MVSAPGQGSPPGTTGMRWLCEVTGQGVDTSTCLACARTRQRPACPFTPALLRALATALEDDPALVMLRQLRIPVIRVTELVGCLRRAWYQRTQPPPLERPSALWARLRGIIFHEALARMGEGLAEQRVAIFLERHGVRAVVTGRVDGYDPEMGILIDYKTLAAASADLHLPIAHHVEQLRLYAWLLGEAGQPPPEIGRLVYVTMSEVRAFDIEMPGEEERRRMTETVVRRVRQLLEAGADGPPGDPREEWECRRCSFRSACPWARCSPGHHRLLAERKAGRATPSFSDAELRRIAALLWDHEEEEENCPQS